MLTRSALLFPFLLAFLLAIITFWINLTVEQQGPKIDGSNRHDPDYTMSNFVNTQTDISGKLRYVLAAAEMVHYPDDDSTVLQRPHFTQYSIDKPYTQIEGLRAYVSSNGQKIEVIDNVKVTRQAFDGKGEMQIKTEKLLILANEDIAKTDAPVVITQAPKTVIHATGMIYDKQQQTVQLFKRVKVHYERPIGLVTKKPAKDEATVQTTEQSNASNLTVTPISKPQLISPVKASPVKISPAKALPAKINIAPNQLTKKVAPKLTTKAIKKINSTKPTKPSMPSKRHTIKLKSRSNNE